MAYFWVNQGQTYQVEFDGGYLWAPKRNSKGHKLYHWDTMSQLNEGDIVFSYVNRKIVAVLSVVKPAYDRIKPPELFQEWGENGYMADVIYTPLTKKLNIPDHWEELRPLLAEKYAPLNRLGDGNEGYLYNISTRMGRYMMDRIDISENIIQDKLAKRIQLEKWAKSFLKALIVHVKNYNGGTKYVTYGQLAETVGYPPPYTGNNFGSLMSKTLGHMGHLIDRLIIDGEKVPIIQALVVAKNTKLPSDGIKEFWPQYPKLSKEKKKDLILQENQKIWDFGNRWDEVLEHLNIITSNQNGDGKSKRKGVRLHNPYGSEGSPEHKALRDYISQNPLIVGLPKNLIGTCEYPLKSGDKVDVVFEANNEIVAVEVKSRRSGVDDIQRGLYQCVKYKSVIEAESLVKKIDKSVRTVLVLESEFPKVLNTVKTRLGLTVLSNIDPSMKN